ncbi:hypothetical protein PGB90_008983 [Kerria lacca]
MNGKKLHCVCISEQSEDGTATVCIIQPNIARRPNCFKLYESYMRLLKKDRRKPFRGNKKEGG